MELQGLLVVRLLGLHLALPLQAVQEIVPVPLLARPPGAPPFVEGFFDYRGQPVPVLRMDRLLDIPEERLGVYAPLVILQVEHALLALHVERSETVVRRPNSAIQPIEADQTLNGLLTGRLTLDGQSVYLLSVDRLLLEKEHQALLACQELLQRRLACLEETDSEISADAADHAA